MSIVAALFITMQSFQEYLSADGCDIIIRLLAKERVKQGGKNKLDRTSKSEIKPIMPPRDRWLRLRQSTRSKGLSTETANILSIRKTIASDIKRFSNDMLNAPKYLSRLFEFLNDITEMAARRSSEIFSEKAFTIVPKFKEDDGQDAIYRPLCIYEDLKTKILISAASSYFTQVFDPYLHEEILSYRPRRKYHNETTVTNGNHAIKSMREFISSHKGEMIYVAECDIQKFFDIINPDIVLECFDRLALKAGIQGYDQARSVLKAYLDSYGFVPDVLSLNNEPAYWSMSRKKHKGKVKGQCLFKWVKEEGFLQAYTPEEFKLQRAYLGVPQGGALSCVISNVVLNDVDQCIVAEEDPDRFFARYGDDIILMHTNRSKCEELLERYKRSLLEHKLIYHNFEDFSTLKDGAKNTKAFWKGKSKPVFLWGPGEGSASEWIGFVGYEVRYDGITRLRISTLDKKFGDINKKYHKCLDSTQHDTQKLIASTIKRMESLPKSVEKFSELKPNQYLGMQMKSLDRYRHKKIAKLDRRLSKRHQTQTNLIAHFEAKADVSFYWTIAEN